MEKYPDKFKKRLTQGTAFFVLLSFTLFNIVYFKTPLASSFQEISAANTLNAARSLDFKNLIQTLTVPKEIGSVKDRYLPEGSLSQNGLVLYLEGAHTNFDSEENTKRLIQYFAKEYGLDLVLLEGGAGALDTLLFKSLPDEKLKEKILADYLVKGDLSGAEIASILDNSFHTHYYGIESETLYQENKDAFLKALQNEPEITKQLNQLGEALKVHLKSELSAQALTFYEQWNLFHKDQMNLVEYAKQLKTFFQAAQPPLSLRGRHSKERPKQSKAEITSLPSAKPLADKSVARNDVRFETIYPELEKLLTLESNEKTLNTPDLDAETTKFIQRFKKEGLPNFPDVRKIEINQLIQDYQTEHLSRGSFLEKLREASQESNIPFHIPESLRFSVEQAKTLSSITGTKLFEEIEHLESVLRDTLPTTQAEKELLLNAYHLELLKRFSRLELVHKEWDVILRAAFHEKPEGSRKSLDPSVVSFLQDDRRAFESLRYLNQLFTPHFRFYALALKRDETLFENALKLIHQKKSKITLIATGGFHSESITAKLKENGLPYLLITPKIEKIEDRSRYLSAMQGKRSFMKHFQGSLWDALARDYAAKVGARHAVPLLKQWRDRIIQNSIVENRITEASKYTKYVETLAQPEIQNQFTRELHSFFSLYFSRVEQLANEKMKYLNTNLKELWEKKEITPKSLAALFTRMDSIGASNLNPALALVNDSAARVIQKEPERVPVEIGEPAEALSRSEVRSENASEPNTSPLPAEKQVDRESVPVPAQTLGSELIKWGKTTFAFGFLTWALDWFTKSLANFYLKPEVIQKDAFVEYLGLAKEAAQNPDHLSLSLQLAHHLVERVPLFPALISSIILIGFALLPGIVLPQFLQKLHYKPHKMVQRIIDFSKPVLFPITGAIIGGMIGNVLIDPAQFYDSNLKGHVTNWLRIDIPGEYPRIMNLADGFIFHAVPLLLGFMQVFSVFSTVIVSFAVYSEIKRELRVIENPEQTERQDSSADRFTPSPAQAEDSVNNSLVNGQADLRNRSEAMSAGARDLNQNAESIHEVSQEDLFRFGAVVVAYEALHKSQGVQPGSLKPDKSDERNELRYEINLEQLQSSFTYYLSGKKDSEARAHFKSKLDLYIDSSELPDNPTSLLIAYAVLKNYAESPDDPALKNALRKRLKIVTKVRPISPREGQDALLIPLNREIVFDLLSNQEMAARGIQILKAGIETLPYESKLVLLQNLQVVVHQSSSYEDFVRESNIDLQKIEGAARFMEKLFQNLAGYEQAHAVSAEVSTSETIRQAFLGIEEEFDLSAMLQYVYEMEREMKLSFTRERVRRAASQLAWPKIEIDNATLRFSEFMKQYSDYPQLIDEAKSSVLLLPLVLKQMLLDYLIWLMTDQGVPEDTVKIVFSALLQRGYQEMMIDAAAQALTNSEDTLTAQHLLNSFQNGVYRVDEAGLRVSWLRAMKEKSVSAAMEDIVRDMPQVIENEWLKVQERAREYERLRNEAFALGIEVYGKTLQKLQLEVNEKTERISRIKSLEFHQNLENVLTEAAQDPLRERYNQEQLLWLEMELEKRNSYVRGKPVFSAEELSKLTGLLLPVFTNRAYVKQIPERDGYRLEEDQGSGRTIMSIPWDIATRGIVTSEDTNKQKVIYQISQSWSERYRVTHEEQPASYESDTLSLNVTDAKQDSAYHPKKIEMVARLLKLLPEKILRGEKFRDALSGGIDLSASRHGDTRFGHYDPERKILGIQRTLHQWRDYVEVFLHEIGHPIWISVLSNQKKRLFAQIKRKIRQTPDLPAMGQAGSVRDGYIGPDDELFSEYLMHYILHNELFRSGFRGLVGESEEEAWKQMYEFYKNEVFDGAHYGVVNGRLERLDQDALRSQSVLAKQEDLRGSDDQATEIGYKFPIEREPQILARKDVRPEARTEPSPSDPTRVERVMERAPTQTLSSESAGLEEDSTRPEVRSGENDLPSDQVWVSQKVQVSQELGVHARVAAELVKIYQKYVSDTEVKLLVKGKEINIGSIMTLMAQGIVSGDEVEIQVRGPRVNSALSEMKKALLSDSDEEKNKAEFIQERMLQSIEYLRQLHENYQRRSRITEHDVKEAVIDHLKSLGNLPRGVTVRDIEVHGRDRNGDWIVGVPGHYGTVLRSEHVSGAATPMSNIGNNPHTFHELYYQHRRISRPEARSADANNLNRSAEPIRKVSQEDLFRFIVEKNIHGQLVPSDQWAKTQVGDIMRIGQTFFTLRYIPTKTKPMLGFYIAYRDGQSNEEVDTSKMKTAKTFSPERWKFLLTRSFFEKATNVNDMEISREGGLFLAFVNHRLFFANEGSANSPELIIREEATEEYHRAKDIHHSDDQATEIGYKFPIEREPQILARKDVRLELRGDSPQGTQGTSGRPDGFNDAMKRFGIFFFWALATSPLWFVAGLILYLVFKTRQPHNVYRVNPSEFTSTRIHRIFQDYPGFSKTHKPSSGMVGFGGSVSHEGVVATLSGHGRSDFFIAAVMNALGDGGQFEQVGEISVEPQDLGTGTGEQTQVQLSVAAMLQDQTMNLLSLVNGKIESIEASGGKLVVDPSGLLTAKEKSEGSQVTYVIKRTRQNAAIQTSQPLTAWLSSEFENMPPYIRDVLESSQHLSDTERAEVVARVLRLYFQYSKETSVDLMVGNWMQFLDDVVGRGNIFYTDCDVLSLYAYIFSRYLRIPTVYAIGFLNQNNDSLLTTDEAHALLIMKVHGNWSVFDPSAIVERASGFDRDELAQRAVVSSGVAAIPLRFSWYGADHTINPEAFVWPRLEQLVAGFDEIPTRATLLFLEDILKQKNLPGGLYENAARAIQHIAVTQPELLQAETVVHLENIMNRDDWGTDAYREPFDLEHIARLDPSLIREGVRVGLNRYFFFHFDGPVGYLSMEKALAAIAMKREDLIRRSTSSTLVSALKRGFHSSELLEAIEQIFRVHRDWIEESSFILDVIKTLTDFHASTFDVSSAGRLLKTISEIGPEFITDPIFRRLERELTRNVHASVGQIILEVLEKKSPGYVQSKLSEFESALQTEITYDEYSRRTQSFDDKIKAIKDTVSILYIVIDTFPQLLRSQTMTAIETFAHHISVGAAFYYDSMRYRDSWNSSDLGRLFFKIARSRPDLVSESSIQIIVEVISDKLGVYSHDYNIQLFQKIVEGVSPDLMNVVVDRVNEAIKKPVSQSGLLIVCNMLKIISNEQSDLIKESTISSLRDAVMITGYNSDFYTPKTEPAMNNKEFVEIFNTIVNSKKNQENEPGEKKGKKKQGHENNPKGFDSKFQPDQQDEHQPSSRPEARSTGSRFHSERDLQGRRRRAEVRTNSAASESANLELLMLLQGQSDQEGISQARGNTAAFLGWLLNQGMDAENLAWELGRGGTDLSFQMKRLPYYLNLYPRHYAQSFAFGGAWAFGIQRKVIWDQEIVETLESLKLAREQFRQAILLIPLDWGNPKTISDLQQIGTRGSFDQIDGTQQVGFIYLRIFQILTTAIQDLGDLEKNSEATYQEAVNQGNLNQLLQIVTKHNNQLQDLLEVSFFANVNQRMERFKQLTKEANDTVLKILNKLSRHQKFGSLPSGQVRDSEGFTSRPEARASNEQAESAAETSENGDQFDLMEDPAETEFEYIKMQDIDSIIKTWDAVAKLKLAFEHLEVKTMLSTSEFLILEQLYMRRIVSGKLFMRGDGQGNRVHQIVNSALQKLRIHYQNLSEISYNLESAVRVRGFSQTARRIVHKVAYPGAGARADQVSLRDFERFLAKAWDPRTSGIHREVKKAILAIFRKKFMTANFGASEPRPTRRLFGRLSPEMVEEMMTHTKMAFDEIERVARNFGSEELARLTTGANQLENRVQQTLTDLKYKEVKEWFAEQRQIRKAQNEKAHRISEERAKRQDVIDAAEREWHNASVRVVDQLIEIFPGGDKTIVNRPNREDQQNWTLSLHTQFGGEVYQQDIKRLRTLGELKAFMAQQPNAVITQVASADFGGSHTRRGLFIMIKELSYAVQRLNQHAPKEWKGISDFSYLFEAGLLMAKAFVRFYVNPEKIDEAALIKMREQFHALERKLYRGPHFTLHTLSSKEQQAASELSQLIEAVPQQMIAEPELPSSHAEARTSVSILYWGKYRVAVEIGQNDLSFEINSERVPGPLKGVAKRFTINQTGEVKLTQNNMDVKLGVTEEAIGGQLLLLSDAFWKSGHLLLQEFATRLWATLVTVGPSSTNYQKTTIQGDRISWTVNLRTSQISNYKIEPIARIKHTPETIPGVISRKIVQTPFSPETLEAKAPKMTQAQFAVEIPSTEEVVQSLKPHRRPAAVTDVDGKSIELINSDILAGYRKGVINAQRESGTINFVVPNSSLAAQLRKATEAIKNMQTGSETIPVIQNGTQVEMPLDADFISRLLDGSITLSSVSEQETQVAVTPTSVTQKTEVVVEEEALKIVNKIIPDPQNIDPSSIRLFGVQPESFIANLAFRVRVERITEHDWVLIGFCPGHSGIVSDGTSFKGDLETGLKIKYAAVQKIRGIMSAAVQASRLEARSVGELLSLEEQAKLILKKVMLKDANIEAAGKKWLGQEVKASERVEINAGDIIRMGRMYLMVLSIPDAKDKLASILIGFKRSETNMKFGQPNDVLLDEGNSLLLNRPFFKSQTADQDFAGYSDPYISRNSLVQLVLAQSGTKSSFLLVNNGGSLNNPYLIIKEEALNIFSGQFSRASHGSSAAAMIDEWINGIGHKHSELRNQSESTIPESKFMAGIEFEDERKSFFRGELRKTEYFTVRAKAENQGERPRQEDVSEIFILKDPARPDLAIEVFVVSDGMGGNMAAGDVASRSVIETFRERLNATHFREDMTRDEFTFIIQAIVNSVPERMQSNYLKTAYTTDRVIKSRKTPQMGAALLVAVRVGNKLFSAHLGDSSLYQMNRISGHVKVKTLEHTLFVESKPTDGRLTGPAPRRRTLTKGIFGHGSTEESTIDPATDVHIFDITGEEFFLLATDGFTDRLQVAADQRGLMVHEFLPLFYQKLGGQKIAAEQLAAIFLNEALDIRKEGDNVTVLTIKPFPKMSLKSLRQILESVIERTARMITEGANLLEYAEVVEAGKQALVRSRDIIQTAEGSVMILYSKTPGKERSRMILKPRTRMDEIDIERFAPGPFRDGVTLTLDEKTGNFILHNDGAAVNPGIVRFQRALDITLEGRDKETSDVSGGAAISNREEKFAPFKESEAQLNGVIASLQKVKYSIKELNTTNYSLDLPEGMIGVFSAVKAIYNQISEFNQKRYELLPKWANVRSHIHTLSVADSRGLLEIYRSQIGQAFFRAHRIDSLEKLFGVRWVFYENHFKKVLQQAETSVTLYRMLLTRALLVYFANSGKDGQIPFLESEMRRFSELAGIASEYTNHIAVRSNGLVDDLAENRENLIQALEHYQTLSSSLADLTAAFNLWESQSDLEHDLLKTISEILADQIRPARVILDQKGIILAERLLGSVDSGRAASILKFPKEGFVGEQVKQFLTAYYKAAKLPAGIKSIRIQLGNVESQLRGEIFFKFQFGWFQQAVAKAQLTEADFNKAVHQFLMDTKITSDSHGRIVNVSFPDFAGIHQKVESQIKKQSFFRFELRNLEQEVVQDSTIALNAAEVGGFFARRIINRLGFHSGMDPREDFSIEDVARYLNAHSDIDGALDEIIENIASEVNRMLGELEKEASAGGYRFVRVIQGPFRQYSQVRESDYKVTVQDLHRAILTAAEFPWLNLAPEEKAVLTRLLNSMSQAFQAVDQDGKVPQLRAYTVRDLERAKKIVFLMKKYLRGIKVEFQIPRAALQTSNQSRLESLDIFSEAARPLVAVLGIILHLVEPDYSAVVEKTIRGRGPYLGNRIRVSNESERGADIYVTDQLDQIIAAGGDLTLVATDECMNGKRFDYPNDPELLAKLLFSILAHLNHLGHGDLLGDFFGKEGNVYRFEDPSVLNGLKLVLYLIAIEARAQITTQAAA